MKKTFIVAFAAIAMVSCNNQAPKVDEKPTEQNAPTELKLAFVEVDSIMTQYTFCKEKSADLEKKGNNIQNTLAQKQQALQNAAVKSTPSNRLKLYRLAFRSRTMTFRL